MFEEQTYENILQRMLENISDEIDKREGSVAHDMLAPKAAELAQFYLELEDLLKMGFVETTYDNFLDSKVSEAGITRIPASYAQGQVTFDLSEDVTSIAAGTIVYTDNGIKFSTDLACSPGDTVNITALDPGMSGNVSVNSVINCELDGVTCTNNDIISGGTDAESDQSLLARYYRKVRAPIISGNVNNYIAWALEIPGVGDVKVLPLWNGRGTVKIILIDKDKQPCQPAKVAEVASYIESVRPVGATITVEAAAKTTINVSATVTVNNGYTLQGILPEIQNKINAYFKDATFVDNDIKYTKIGTMILATDGVVDYSNLKINNGTSNITINNTVPTLGTVTLS